MNSAAQIYNAKLGSILVKYITHKKTLKSAVLSIFVKNMKFKFLYKALCILSLTVYKFFPSDIIILSFIYVFLVCSYFIIFIRLPAIGQSCLTGGQLSEGINFILQQQHVTV